MFLFSTRFPRCLSCLRVAFPKNEIIPSEFKFHYAPRNHRYIWLKNPAVVNVIGQKILTPGAPSIRFKSKSKKRIKQTPYEDRDDDEDEEVDRVNYDNNGNDDDDDDFIKGKGIETKTYSMPSLRVDLLLKTAFNTPRKKIEEFFYSKKIWINGTLLMKKGTVAHVGDEIDIIIDVSQDNNKFITVKRMEILKVTQDENKERFLVKLRKTKSMLIENYKGVTLIQ